MRLGSHEWIEYCLEKYGPPAFGCGGASQGMYNAQQAEANVTKELGNTFTTYFGNNQATLQSIMDSTNPIIAAGPSQYGYSPAEDAAQRSQATAEITSTGQAASDLVRSELATEGGGNTYLPSGSEAATEAGLAEKQAEQQAAAQEEITVQGYQQGAQNYENAVKTETAAPAELEAPVIQAGEAESSAAGASMQGATAINQANQAPLQAIGGIIGGFAGGLGTGLGKKLG